VNNEPITLYEFQARKKLLMTINNIQTLNPNIEKQINKLALDSLINEQILSQYANKVNNKISEKDIDDAISNIEERNKMPKGHLMKSFKDKEVGDSFQGQVRSELIKVSIFNQLSRSVTISPKEIDAVIFSTNSKDAQVVAQVFKSKNKDNKTLEKMYNLQKYTKTCGNIKESTYNKFANMEQIEDNLSKLDNILQPIIKDLNPDQKSTVFETEESFEFVSVCSKNYQLTNEESNYVINFLSNKKMSQKALKFLQDLRKKAYIKVML
jgi:Mg/Co/Ni transporter MgtE